MKKLLFITCLFLSAAGCKKTHEIINNGITPNDLLSNRKYDKLIVEVQYMSGFIPTQEASDRIRQFLEQRLNKSGGIYIVYTSIPAEGRGAYSVEDIRKIEKENRTENTKGNTAAIYILFLDGDYAYNSGNSKVLGVAYENSSVAIFEKTIRDYSGGIGEPQEFALEATVADHELGHLFGLVNNGSPMEISHEDPAHAHHCDNANCLMNHTVETSDIVGLLVGNTIPALDANCIRDLQRNGGK
ncbi:MAG: hypothetical protein FD123_2351 [Bacteroidetes bacterium]|nr:MAG: hypothetical protein FD123_2351 [Bacteroidota bacterium]